MTLFIKITAPYSPQLNGITELKNQILKEMMNIILISLGLSQNMWEEAILSTIVILNKTSQKKRDQTLYELWKCHKPFYKHLSLEVFG